jgi:hypothetical protein
VERDELEIAPILEPHERVVREAAGVLAAWRHGEPALAMLGDGRVEIQYDEDHVIESADHEGSAS